MLANKKIEEYDKIFDYSEIQKKEADELIKVIIKNYKNSDKGSEKAVFFIDQLLQSLHKVITAYEIRQIKKMPSITVEEKKAKSERAQRLQKIKLGIALASGIKGMFTSKNAKEFADTIMQLYMEAGSIAIKLIWERKVTQVADFVTNSSSEATQYAQNIAGEIGGSAKNLATIGKGFEVGYTIGNKLIPFLYDFAFATNASSANINDAKVSMYGSLIHKIEIFRLANDSEELIWSSQTNKTSSGQFLVDTPKDSILKYKVYAAQANLFDNEERSPWEVNTFITPRHVLSVLLSTNETESYTRLGICVEKTLVSFRTKFARYHFDESDGDKTIVSCTSSTDIEAANEEIFIDDNIYSLSDFDEKAYLTPFKLKSLDQPILTK
ncbi:MAG: hypothetical protein CSB47_09015 [Proteobacteria bacterium]|nr:MAG: hypothetical protein CSB47_09015 [Pseudomonadota bacterium]